MLKILLIENVFRNFLEAKKSIISRGFECIFVDNFKDAENIFATSDEFDAVITTIQIPFYKGSRIVDNFGEHIASLCKKAKIPCVVCTIMDTGSETKIQGQPLVIKKDWEKALDLLEKEIKKINSFKKILNYQPA